MAGVVEAVMQAHYTRQYQGESITADAVADPAVQTAFERYRAAVVGTGEPVAWRYVHLDYAGRKISRYGTHPERVNGHDPIETHPTPAGFEGGGGGFAGNL